MRTGTLAAGVRWAFTDRTAGAGASRPPYDQLNLARHVGDDAAAVTANRAVVAGSLDVAPADIRWMSQVHGATAVRVSGPAGEEDPASAPPEADALVTADVGRPLAVLVADCVPVLLADAEAGVVAAVHAGRRGLELGVVPAAMHEMTHAGAQPSRVQAVLGPAVGGCCYEVPADLQEQVAAVVPAARATTTWGTPSLDLRAGLHAVLQQAGVAAVTVVGGCTVEDPSAYSHRRDGVTGRFAGFVWRDPTQ